MKPWQYDIEQIIAIADLTFLKQASTKFEGIMFL